MEQERISMVDVGCVFSPVLSRWAPDLAKRSWDQDKVEKNGLGQKPRRPVRRRKTFKLQKRASGLLDVVARWWRRLESCEGLEADRPGQMASVMRLSNTASGPYIKRSTPFLREFKVIALVITISQ